MPDTRHLTVVFTDIKGFTQRTSQQTRAELMDLLDRHEELVWPVAEAHGGKLVKTIGDAFLLTFESPTNAVLAGIAVQEKLREYNASREAAERIEIRVAINSGEVAVTENDIYGEPVNIASRIEGIAEPGEVYFTEAVYLSMNKREVPSSEVGYRQLKGIPEKIKVYKVLWEHPPTPSPPPPATAQPVAPEPPAAAVPATAPKTSPAVTPESAVDSEAAPAGFWMRGLALLLDAIVFALLVSGLVDTIFPPPPAEEVVIGADGDIDEIENIHIGEGGIEITSKDGERVHIGEDGVHVEPGGGAPAADATGVPPPPGDFEEEDDGGGLRLQVQPTGVGGWLKVVLWLLYLTLFWAFWGATPGKLALGLRVVRSSDGQRPELPRALLRAVFFMLSVIPLGLGLMWAAFDAHKRAWHDRAAETRVVRS